MTIQEVSRLPLGTKVYRIFGGQIRSFITLAFDPNNADYFYLINGSNNTDTIGVYLPTAGGDWESNYNKAKDVMWEQKIEEVRAINRIYFDGEKEIDFRSIKEKYELGDLKFDITDGSPEFVDGINYILDKLKNK